ncbi:MAG: hypothetical protein AAFO99_11895 [Bacteroidota bacterium]
MEENSVRLFKKVIDQYTETDISQEWTIFKQELKPVHYKKGQTIFPSTEKCKDLLYITKGIVASEYFDENERIITRFFRVKNLCSNITSFLTNQVVNDHVFAITEVSGVLISQKMFNHSYLYSNGIGLYFRKRLMENLLEAKMFISIKTMSSIESKLNFLYEDYPEIIRDTPWKYIASFIGVTPEWLSKTLKKRTHRFIVE